MENEYEMGNSRILYLSWLSLDSDASLQADLVQLNAPNQFPKYFINYHAQLFVCVIQIIPIFIWFMLNINLI